MQIGQVLMELGLQDKEPEIYLALLKTPGAQPASIIAARADLNRTTVYKALIKLARMGLVTKTQHRGITCFFAENPDEHLENLLKNKRRHLDMVNENLLAALPAIQGMQRHELHKPRMKYYEGVEGIIRVYQDTIMEGKPIYAFENVDHMADSIKNFIFNEYIPERIAENIFAYVIVPESKENANFKKADKKSLRETRIIKETAFPIKIEINIYGEKTAFFSYKAEEMFGVILDSQDIAKSMKAIFDLCWEFSG